MKAVFFSLLAAVMLALPVQAQEAQDESESGLALPRMVSLRSNLINARSGPGARYPIEWVYMQKGAPVEIVAEFELWRKIKDWQGSESWVHKSMLSGKRTIKMTTPGESNIYDKDHFDLLDSKAYCLSLSDQYWVKSVDENILWEDINFFEHEFSEDIGKIFFDRNFVYIGISPFIRWQKFSFFTIY